MELIVPFFLSLILGGVLTRFLLAFDDEKSWLIRTPTADRWHEQATPSMGGIAMFSAFTICFLLFRQFQPDSLKVLLGGALIFLLGFIDDLRPLPPYSKLVGQIATACLMILLGVHVAWPGNPLVFIPLTLFWIIGITNAFNLLDNMDGLAGGVAVIGTFFLLALSILTGHFTLSMPLLAIFIGSVTGFLRYNIYPARIFMGDCGSQWIGFTLAVLTILDTWRSASNLFLTLATPLLVLAVPIFDTTLVTLNRKIHGKPVSQGGKDHASHRLVALGMSQKKTVTVLWGLSALFGLSVLFAHIYNVQAWGLLISGVVIFIVVFGIFLTDAKVYNTPQSIEKSRPWIPSVDLFYRRRIIEILIDTLLIGLSYVLAYLLRYDWNVSEYTIAQLGLTLPIIITTKLILFMMFGLYRGLWTYIDFEGVSKLFRTSLLASAGTVLAILGIFRFNGFSRSLFAIDFVVLFALMGGTRALLRAMRESLFAYPDQGRRVLVIGAGDAGRFVLEEIRKNRNWNLRPVAILDDDVSKKGRPLVGVPVVGGVDNLSSAVQEYKIEQIIIAIPSLETVKRTFIEEACRRSGLPFASLLSFEKMIVDPLRTAETRWN